MGPGAGPGVRQAPLGGDRRQIFPLGVRDTLILSPFFLSFFFLLSFFVPLFYKFLTVLLSYSLVYMLCNSPCKFLFDLLACK